jgi:hypothetical protein
LKNAYNEAHRTAVLQSLLDNPTTRKFARYFHASMSPKSRMFGIGVSSETGVQQGAPDATFEFTQVIHQDVVELHRVVTEAGGACCFYSDDGYVVGPPDVVFPALKKFQTSLFTRTNLVLVEDKCEVYSEDPAIARDYLTNNPEFNKFNLGALPDVDTTQATAGAGYGIKILGVPVGDLRYIDTILSNKVTSIREDIFNSTRILSGCNLSESSDDSIGLEEPVNNEAETLTIEGLKQRRRPAVITKSTARVSSTKIRLLATKSSTSSDFETCRRGRQDFSESFGSHCRPRIHRDGGKKFDRATHAIAHQAMRSGTGQ